MDAITATGRAIGATAIGSLLPIAFAAIGAVGATTTSPFSAIGGAAVIAAITGSGGAIMPCGSTGPTIGGTGQPARGSRRGSFSAGLAHTTGTTVRASTSIT